MASLDLVNLEKTYGNGFKAVHGINLSIRDGEFMAFVGPSGCAKSTTLRMIAGLETVTSGEIRIGDRVVNNIVPGERGIAMVFQNYALYPHMKVFNNLAFGLKLARRKRPEIEGGVAATAKLLEIEQLLERLPKQLSGGQAQRVAVGRAIIKKPQVFLFDEPLSNLDAKLCASMRVRLIELHRALKDDGLSSTVAYVTHDQTEAMTMGDRICVMKDGRIMQVDDPVTIYSRPANAFVGGFIGSPEMNIVPATLGGSADAPTLTIAGHTLRYGAALGARIAPGTGKAVQLGIRPQHLQPVGANGDGLPGRVAHVEYMGHEVYLHVAVGGLNLVSVVPGEAFDRSKLRDDRIWLRPAEDLLHLFDAETGQTISLGRA
ncbi:MAG: ABC transporter ATP-binding protein [Devosia sp.]